MNPGVALFSEVAVAGPANEATLARTVEPAGRFAVRDYRLRRAEVLRLALTAATASASSWSSPALASTAMSSSASSIPLKVAVAPVVVVVMALRIGRTPLTGAFARGSFVARLIANGIRSEFADRPLVVCPASGPAVAGKVGGSFAAFVARGVN
jgi:hypothetical protein